MKVAIVTGGTISGGFVEKRLETSVFDKIIAVDRGAEFFLHSRFLPGYIVGDFDSVAPGTIQELQKKSRAEIKKYSSEKDETDTELAMQLAISLGAEEIELYGATGTRLDHVLGNIQLLKMALDHGVRCHILDENNRISMIRESLTIPRDLQYGQYVSLIPFTPCVKGLTLTGMKYPLYKYTLENGLARGVSNEISEEVAEIKLEEGILLVIESRDGE